MFGWINECTEELVVTKFGAEAWHRIKERANCKVEDGGFVRYDRYSDGSTVDLVVAASEELGLSTSDILEAFGAYFLHFTRTQGYDSLLACQGGSLRTWLANVNALHDHLESSFPPGFIKPTFWCEDDEENGGERGSVLLHYFSQRGNLLAPVVKGVVKEVASHYFNVQINMEEIQIQDIHNANYSTWRITAVDPSQQWKFEANVATTPSESAPKRMDFASCPFASPTTPQTKRQMGKALGNMVRRIATRRQSTGSSMVNVSFPEISLPGAKMKELFPYHVVLNQDFVVVQTGPSLMKLLKLDNLLGSHVSDFLKIIQPAYGEWTMSYLKKLQDQTFFMEHRRINLKGNWISIDAEHILLIVSPDVKNVQELHALNLTMSDLPLSSFQRDAIFLGEHIHSEVLSASKLDKLSKKLRNERNVSNALLYSVLPKSVADDLRDGKAVDPEYHENVTVFFSDVVSFTSISSQVPLWEVIDMVNRLFCIMDCLCKHFGLYKIDTIGDAFICCGGLPTPQENHASAVANFAIAVQHCVKQVVNPADQDFKPIQIRIGIHSGPVTAGVVGMSTPKYTVFGNTVNCASRHESTGLPDRIQISKETHDLLLNERVASYKMESRGLVNMKGKGELETWWLNGADDLDGNVGTNALDELYQTVQVQLVTRTFSKRTYFARGNLRNSHADLALCEGISDPDSNSLDGDDDDDGIQDDS